MAKLGQFAFNLPDDLIADKPADYRDDSRLMVIDRKSGNIKYETFEEKEERDRKRDDIIKEKNSEGELKGQTFKEITNYFGEGDVVIVNNSKVFPARLYGIKEKTGAKIEVFLLRELNPDNHLWDVVVDPARKVRIGNKLIFSNDQGDMLVAEVIDNTTSKGRTIRFYFDGNSEDFQNLIYKLGHTPLPKYIKRDPLPEDEDDYQTIFAKTQGSIAVPAAGLHFSREVLKWFEIIGTELVDVTLHIGMASFKDIEVEDLSKHRMESESFAISPESAGIINNGIRNKKRICAVGTSTLRAIESSVSTQKEILATEGWTEKFIFPPYEFKIANALITNFHAPKSPFYIAVAAFTGLDLLKSAYDIALKEKYRFHDYGDVMLIL